jgi:hypothetical protein
MEVSDVAALRKVYDNPNVMALKRKFDDADKLGTGFVTRDEFLERYYQLCPWANKGKNIIYCT